MNKLKLHVVFNLILAATLLSCTKMNDCCLISARLVIENSLSSPLAIPMVMNATNASFAAKSNIVTIGGNKLKTLSYGSGEILGPTLTINQGEELNIAFENQLTEATNIHWHGLEVPAAQDGYPTDLIQAGNSFSYNFRITNRPGTYWYHPHPEMATASQAYQGLAGFYCHITRRASIKFTWWNL